MNKVIVKVRGEQRDAEGEVNKIEMMAEGEHYFRNGKHYILYDDATLDEKKNTATVLKIAADSMPVMRKGAVVQDQRFALEKESRSTYHTPYGDLALSVETKSIEIVYGTVSGNIDVAYAMSVNGRQQSMNELHIEVCADESEKQRLN